MSLVSANLAAFTAVVRTGSFTKAALSLSVTQSALSQRIASLEEELRTTVLIRDRKGVRLTDAGEKLLRYCQSKEALEADFLSSFQSGGFARPSYRIAGFSSVIRSLVLPAVARLSSGSGEAHLNILTREIPELPGLFRQAEADYLLTYQPSPLEGVETICLGYEEYVLVRSKKGKSPWYLDHHEEDRITLDYLKHTGHKNLKIPRRYLDEVYSLIDGVKLGLGMAVLPRHLIDGDAELRIVEPRQSLRLPVWLHYWKQPYPIQSHLALVAALEKRAREILSS
ncbi:MAG: LysR family transcriptional regulator [Bdellovibrionota bacterium]